VNTKKHSLRFEILLLILIPVFGMALGVGTIFLLGLKGTDYGNLIVNLFFLGSITTLVRLFRFSAEDLGLKVIKDQMQKHVTLSLAIFTFYMLFYIFIIRISMLKPFSSNTIWGLVTFLIVVIAEEAYFRGALYSFFERRFSAKTALMVSSILFGLFHAQQGLHSVISRTFTG
jgi:membrane protease YdiL (CAAX protease family)